LTAGERRYRLRCLDKLAFTFRGHESVLDCCGGRYSDPGKLKAYLATGLSIVVTDVPPNARKLTSEAGTEIANDGPAALADAISRALASPEQWQARPESALAYARRFDWNVPLGDLLGKLDLSPSAKPIR
jgi:glycosyltransferase involved in cell wall biosynthesis